MWDQHSSDGMFMGDQAAIGQRSSEQTITRWRTRPRSRIASRGGCLLLVAASIACTPALVGCSSSASNDNSAAASAYPSRSLAELFRASQNAAPPAQTISPPPAAPNPQPPAAWTATAGTPLAGVSPPGVAFARAPIPPLATTARPPISTAMVNPPGPAAPSSSTAVPAAAAPPDEYDAAADAYPSEALFDIFRRDAREAAASSNPPAPSNSAAQAAIPAVAGQPAPVGQPVATAPGATATAAPSSAASVSPGGYDAAASAYPSVSLHDVIFGPRPPTN
jgi:hypothetical protein